VEEACELLWEIGRNDSRELNRYPEHPIRVLASLAGYEEGKPVAYNEKVLTTAEAWLEDPALPEYKYSPLDVVDPILAKQAEYQRAHGHSITIGYLRINQSAVSALRKRAVSYVEKSLAHPHPIVAKRALDSVHDIVTFPPAFLGREITEDELEGWKEEQLEGVRLLKNFFLKNTNPALLSYAVDTFDWYAEHGRPDEVADGIRDALAHVAETLEFKLATALTRAFFHIGKGHADFQQLQAKFMESLTDELRGRFPGQEAALKIEAVVNEIVQAGITLSNSQFLVEYAIKDPGQGQLLLEHIIGHRQCALVPYAGAILFGLRFTNENLAISLTEDLIRQQSEILDQQVARAYASLDLKNINERDFVLLEYLLHRDKDTRISVLQALRRLQDAELVKKRRGIALILTADIGEDSQMAEALLESIDPQFGISPELMSDEEIDLILQKLVFTREITHQAFHFNRFLTYLVERSPRRVMRFFLDRIDHAVSQTRGESRYSPIPFGLEGLFAPISGSLEYVEILRDIAKSLDGANAVRKYFLTKLFGLIAGAFDPSIQKVILELAKDKNEGSFAIIGTLLAEAPRTFVFSEKSLTAELLELANSVSSQALQNVSRGLWASTQSGVFHGTPGQPSPDHVSIRDQSIQAMSEYSNQPVVAAFFKNLASYMEGTIKDDLDRDEEMFFE
jgi:hypothetical protein